MEPFFFRSTNYFFNFFPFSLFFCEESEIGGPPRSGSENLENDRDDGTDEEEEDDEEEDEDDGWGGLVRRRR